MKTNKYLIPVSALLALAVASPSFAGPVITNNAGFNANLLGATDDGSTGAVSIGFTADLFGVSSSSLFVNNNGNLTFGSALSQYTPGSLATAGLQIIAPFFADVDTRGAGDGTVTYGVGTYDGDTAFAATWNDVGYYFEHNNLLNDFQVILVDRSDIGAGDFDIYFNYDQIQWETGDASGGEGGLGGSSALAGYSNGSDTSYELPGSSVNGALLDSNLTTGLANTTNDGVTGQFLFEVRNGDVIQPPAPPGVADTASTAELLGAVLVGLGLAKRKIS